jgi:hypothetical protein
VGTKLVVAGYGSIGTYQRNPAILKNWSRDLRDVKRMTSRVRFGASSHAHRARITVTACPSVSMPRVRMRIAHARRGMAVPFFPSLPPPFHACHTHKHTQTCMPRQTRAALHVAPSHWTLICTGPSFSFQPLPRWVHFSRGGSAESTVLEGRSS